MSLCLSLVTQLILLFHVFQIDQPARFAANPSEPAAGCWSARPPPTHQFTTSLGSTTTRLWTSSPGTGQSRAGCPRAGPICRNRWSFSMRRIFRPTLASPPTTLRARPPVNWKSSKPLLVSSLRVFSGFESGEWVARTNWLWHGSKSVFFQSLISHKVCWRGKKRWNLSLASVHNLNWLEAKMNDAGKGEIQLHQWKWSF